MNVDPEFMNTRNGLIDRVIQYVIKKLPDDEAPLVKDFLKHYYMRVSPEDLGTRSILDLYGAVVSHWHFIEYRTLEESKIRVCNPNQEEHGWRSSHTVIEVITDDKPFIIDSIRMALTREEYNIHLLIHLNGIKFKRNKAGKIVEICKNIDEENDTVPEIPLYIEIDRQSDPKVLTKIKKVIETVLKDVDIVVKGWQPMQVQLEDCVSLLQADKQNPKLANIGDLEDAITFMQWIADQNFFLQAFARYKFSGKGEDAKLEYVADSALGLYSKPNNKPMDLRLIDMAPSAREVILSKQRLMVGKMNEVSTLHRRAYQDFAAIKFYDAEGELTEVWRFIGLYTAIAYNSLIKDIPFIRNKIDRVFKLSGFYPSSHDGKALLNILENIPRDDLFHATANELHELSVGILCLQERQKISLFVRKDAYGQYYSCLVFVPRDQFNSSIRKKMQDILLEALGGYSVNFSTKFSESILTRVHFVVRVDPLVEKDYSIEEITQKLTEVTRTWKNDLRDALHEFCGEEKANELMKYYADAFPAGYCESFSARIAVIDIEHIETFLGEDSTALAMSLYRPIEDNEGVFRFKLFRLDKPFPLSDVVPMLENMGLRIISERPYHIKRVGEGNVWINDYRMLQPTGQTLSPELVKNIFQNAFAAVWYGRIENDGFNRLVLSSMLTWREVSVLRAYFKYLWQAGLGFGQSSVEDALFNNSQLAKELVQYFIKKFDPSINNGLEVAESHKTAILQGLDEVQSLNEDRIIRTMLQTMEATLRTNYFQTVEDDSYKDYLSFKLKSDAVPNLPKPHPLYEIFVYSTRVEGVHLRGAKVARGGLRWSDRHDDFRTEILGLMKAQQVKNAVIVPLGAKGGFVVKTNLVQADRESVIKEGIECYKIFIHGLLDITDNRVSDQVITPENVVRYDEDDPYLVVAADKGTATFSDIANEIALKYNFWLGDAFASGGSAGYDHKKMGITARGAWESVKMHFLRLGIDTQKTPFTVVGIGDLAGDVFGNGVLLSPYIKLIAAFNHQHIFIDPNPDTEAGFKERERIFNLTRSSWTDYDANLISKGGGVFSRAQKFIQLSPEIKVLLGLNCERIIPNDLIKVILQAKVDLLWNGGIGTFVKASTEADQEVGDRNNDAIRIKAAELRCKVVGEGGNLGFTQLARIEYAKNGGLINTDAIDNSAGVNCSDNEVNIKVLLNDCINNGDLTLKQRNKLLEDMEVEVAEIVLRNNRQQNKSITVAESQAAESLEMHYRLMKSLEKTANLDRKLEFLPDKDEVVARKAEGRGLTRPELAVLLAYAKIVLKKDLLGSDALEDPYVVKALILAFPSLLREKFQSYMLNHRLKREIISTQISNAIIDEMGINFVSRLQDETGAKTSQIVCAYMVAREVYKVSKVRAHIDKLGISVSSELQLMMVKEFNRLIRRATRWFLRNRRGVLDIEKAIEVFSPKVAEIQDNLTEFLQGKDLEIYQKNTTELVEKNVPADLACIISSLPAMSSALDIVEIAMREKLRVLDMTKVYFALGSRLELIWFRNLIKKQAICDNWEALARAAFRDDVDRQQGKLSVAILQSYSLKTESLQKHVVDWFEINKELLTRWEYFVAELKSSKPEFTMFAVALRELLDLSNSLQYSVSKNDGNDL